MPSDDRCNRLGVFDPIYFDLCISFSRAGNPDGAYTKKSLEQTLTDLDIPNIRMSDLVCEFGQNAFPFDDAPIGDSQSGSPAIHQPK